MSSTKRTPKDRSTHDGGYSAMVTRIAATPHTYRDLIARKLDLEETPRFYRCNWWQGEMAALLDELDRRDTAFYLGTDAGTAVAS